MASTRGAQPAQRRGYGATEERGGQGCVRLELRATPTMWPRSAPNVFDETPE
uniref:Uncharacterized protein n=1 Tax=Arundo donax TaxID=35708 RepID=A0A0A8ZBM0_ARUDO